MSMEPTPARAVLNGKAGRMVAAGLGFFSLLGGFTLLAGGSPAGAIPPALYVSTYGSDTGNNCQSKSAPCLTLGHAYGLSVSGQTINIAGGTYNGNVFITHNLNIVGTNSDGSLDVLTTTLTRGGSASSDYVLAADAVVTISNLVVNGENSIGGGIVNIGTLTLNNVTVENNISSLYSGAGIEDEGTLLMNGGDVSGNQSTNGSSGGGLTVVGGAAVATLKDVKLNHNTASNLGGGILLYVGTLKLQGSTAIHNNSAESDGGGIEKCPSTVLQIGPDVSNTANTPNNFGTLC